MEEFQESEEFQASQRRENCSVWTRTMFDNFKRLQKWLNLNSSVSGVLRILALARLNRCFYIYKLVREQSMTKLWRAGIELWSIFQFWKLSFSHDSMYLLTKFGGRMGKYLHTARAQRGPCAMTESQIFFHPARPNLVNKYFIIWPLWKQIFLKF